ncbi:MAG: dihydrofolate reductase family protein [Planctomyces sp.]|jgi:dihydrofolate reductase
MSPKVSVFVAVSLDGYIAREDGRLDWLDAANASVPKGEDCGFADFMKTVDTLVMGRRTYEKVLTFGMWPYGETPVIVMSSRPLAFPATSEGNLSHSSETPTELLHRLHRCGVRHIYVDGADTIQRFLVAGLVDDITTTIIPVLLGSGIRLFGTTASDLPLKLVHSKTYEFGFVQLQYTVTRPHDSENKTRL